MGKRCACVLVPLQGDCSEHFVCTASTNGKDGRPVFDFQAQASVATPLLDVSSRVLHFHHMYEKDMSVAPIKVPLTVRNISKLPLQCVLKCAAPFSVDQTSLRLNYYECATVHVSFDPAFKGDQQSGVIKQKLMVRMHMRTHA